MSSQSTANPPSISRNAAKKRAKRAAATARSSSQPPVTATATAEVRVDLGDAVDPNDPDHLYLPPGDYPSGPVDLEYEPFFDDTEFPPGANNGHAHHQQNFPLPFLDYTLSPYNQHPHPFANLPASVNITNEDLIQTANELYRRMADPKFASDDAYWTSLPPHIRNFIREAVPFGDPQVNGGGRDQSIHSLAQRIVSVASQGMGLQGVGANMLNGGMPPPRGGQPPPTTQAGLARELGFHAHPDARDDDEYEDEELDQDVEPGHAAANGDAPKKKNKKKKKKGANATVADVPLTPSTLPPVPPIKQPPPTTPHPQQAPPAARPVLNPPPPPATNAPATPIPSSRAQQKQPMAATPAANPAGRSARSSGKQPQVAQPAPAQGHSHPPAKAAPNKGKAPANAPPAKIWTQASPEDRENIRSFWLGLNDAERRDLLQIEKDSVIKKMKESHRTACPCAVCGRKKINIEAELSHLYDKYYQELQDYAADQQAASLGRSPAPPGAGPFPGSVEIDATGQVTRFDHRAPDRLPPEEYDDEGSDVYEEDEYDDDEEDLEDDQSDEADAGDELDDPQQPVARQPRKAPSVKAPAPRAEGAEDFVTFGQDTSLRNIKGGVLTAADDLSKNDGTKFLDMMERLAVARSVREEQNIRDMQADTEDEDDKIDPVTEAEHIEEGHRMFQIFAARLFEQRVLQAYQERLSQSRSEQFLRELDDEEELQRAKEEKRAKEAAKKKEKKRLQKQRADEEKAAKEAAAAEEQRLAKEKQAEQDRERQKKAEEERVRREAVKRAAAEEAARKEAERKKRQQEEREREEEAKRKRLEAQEKARKEKEAREKEAKEKERKDREEKAAKEKAEKERVAKEKAEKDRLAKEKAEKDRQAKLEAEREREKARKEEEARKAAAAAEHAKQQAEELAKRQAAAQRDREAKEHAAFERAAAAERAATESSSATVRPSTSAEKNRSNPLNLARPPSVPQAGSIPLSQPSPIKAAPIASSSMHRGQTGPFPSSVGSASKAQPQPFLSQQPMSAGSYGAPRVPPIGQNLAPGYRQAYPSQSPVFSPPTNGGPSPMPQTGRPFPEPSPPGFEHLRTAPIGMGFPQSKGGRTGPIGSMDEFSPPPIGSRNLSSAQTSSDLPTQLNALSLMNDSSASASGSSHQPPPGFGIPPAPAPAPIGPPKAAPQPIGRPSFHDTAPSHGLGASSLASASSLKSPTDPVQVLGSAALGSDDDVVVQPARRNTSNGWDVPAGGAGGGTGAIGGGASRWSTAPSIWGGAPPAPAPPLPNTSIVNDNVNSALDARQGTAHSHWSRAPAAGPFGASTGQPRQNSLSVGLGGGAGPFGAAPGSNPFGQGVNPFSQPTLGGQQQPHSQHHH